MVRVTFRAPEDLVKRARAVAALRGETLSDALRRALRDYVARGKEELAELHTE
jgi:predicted transcriptional regulator